MDTTKSNTLIIYRCVNSDNKTQGFHDSRACARLNPSNRMAFPVKIISKIDNTCPQGYGDFYNLMGMKSHGGIDRGCFFREPVYFDANFEGWMKSEVDNTGGIGVDVVSNERLIQCTEPNCHEKHYIKRRYWHLERVIGYDKKPIKLGDAIGLGDSTGASSGNHVHEGTKWCDKQGRGLHTNNGYFGNFDYTDPRIGGQYYPIFVRDIVGLPPEKLDLAQKLSKTIYAFQMVLRATLGR